MDTKYEWIIKRNVWVKQFSPPTPGNVLAYDPEGEHAVVMSFDNGQLMFNGEYCDVGDDLTSYLSVMDDAIGAYPEAVLSRTDVEEKSGRGGQGE